MSLGFIDNIENIRRMNNSFWMNILRIAYIHAPDQTVAEMKCIVAGDAEVSKYFKEMIESHENRQEADRLGIPTIHRGGT